MGQFYLDQDSYRYRYDDGGEAAATWRALINTDVSIPVDTIFRLRHLLQEYGGKDGADQMFELWASYDSGAYFQVTPTSSYIKCVGSANDGWTLTDEDSVTQQLGSGTMDTGCWDDDGEMGENSQIDITAGHEIEVENCLQIVGEDVAGGKTIQTEVRFNGGGQLTSYTRRGTITIIKANVYYQSCSGAITPTGAVTKKVSPAAISGAISFVGGVTKKVSPATLQGAISFVGGVTRLPKKALAGALTFIGGVVRLPKKSLAGSITPAGQVTKKAIPSALQGAITFIGNLSTSKVFMKALAGAITFAGNVTKQPRKALAGSIAPAGALAKKIQTSLAGAISFSGDVTRKTLKSLAGTFTSSGILVKRTLRSLAGAISFSGALDAVKQGAMVYYKTLEGAITFEGSVTKKVSKTLTGAITFVGSLWRAFLEWMYLEAEHVTLVELEAEHITLVELEAEHITLVDLEGLHS